MRISASKIYLLCFGDKHIGKVTLVCSGLGWWTGFFEPAPTFQDYRKFFEEWEEADECPERVVPELERKFGKAWLDPRNWKVTDEWGRKQNENIPFIQEGLISWRAY